MHAEGDEAMNLEQVCSREIVSYLTTAMADLEKVPDLLARLGSPISSPDCDEAVIDYLLPRVTPRSPLAAQAAYLDILGRRYATLSDDRRQKVIELSEHANLSEAQMIMAVSDALRWTAIDMRKTIAPRVRLDWNIQVNAIDDPVVYWFAYLWSLGDKKALSEMRNRFHSVTDSTSLCSYFSFLDAIDDHYGQFSGKVPSDQRVALLREFFEDRRSFTYLTGEQATVGQCARDVADHIQQSSERMR